MGFDIGGYIFNSSMASNQFANQIITKDLVLYFDAENINSYIGSGSTWADLSGQNNTGTLVGSPTYTSNPNYFTFAANKNVSTALSNISLSAATFIAWVYSTQTQANYTGVLFNRIGIGGSTVAATGLDLKTINSVGYHWNDASATYNWNSGLYAPNNAWSMIAITVNSTIATAYLCQSSGITTATNTTSHPSLSGLNFFIGCDPTAPSDRAFIGRIANTQIYNRDLTLAEISYNYNALKSRFGL